MVSAVDPAGLLPIDLPRSIGDEILDTVHDARLSGPLEEAVLEALSGEARVLPEGKANGCVALTFATHSRATHEESLQVVPVAAAMEMLMAAGDIIDDVQDDEAELPSDRRSFGRVLETVSMLLMLSHSAAQRAVLRGTPPDRVLKALRCLDEWGVAALRGQTQDVELEERARVSVQESMSVTALKSASLARCAAEMGASLATDDTDEIDLYGRFGWHLGLTQQLMNDVAAVWPGAPVKSDLRLGKKTLPVVFALSLRPGHSRHAQVVRSHHDEGSRSQTSEEEVKQALWRCGAIHYTWIVAAREKAKAAHIGDILAAESPGEWPLARLLN